MESNNKWVPNFENHEIFTNLRSQFNEGGSIIRPTRTPKNILTSRGGEVLFWNETSLSLFSFNIKTSLINPQIDFAQEFVWVNAPKFDIERLLLSPNENELALYGEEGVQILSLPFLKGKDGLYKDGAKCITCQCASIDERYFITSGFKLLGASWHPGFSLPNVLFVLTSDNYFRIYTSAHQYDPVGTINLNHMTSSGVVISSRNILGESFVAFDFGESRTNPNLIKNDKLKTKDNLTNLNKKNTPGLTKSFNFNDDCVDGLKIKVESGNKRVSSILNGDFIFDGDLNVNDDGDVIDDVTWVIYLLMGNGQVCMCSLTYENLKFRHTLYGPLRMFPAAEDNYGCDACSIIHINTDPSVLVIATCEGKLHNCILLGSDGNADDEGMDKMNNNDDSNNNANTRNNNNNNSSSNNKINNINMKSLYVYETIELEMELVLSGDDDDYNNDDVIDPYNLPILLYKDPSVRERYHCCHITGLHSIMLPWLQKLQEFFSSDDDFLSSQVMNSDDQSIVEHLVCTKPLKSSPLKFIIGYTQVCDLYLGTKVICLTSDFNVTTLPMLQSYKIPSFPLSIENESETKFQSVYREDLCDKIKKILTKSASIPFFSCKLDVSSNAQDYFKLLCRTTQIFREEYIQKIDLARIELEKNVARLQKNESRQKIEINELRQELVQVETKQITLVDKLKQVIRNENDLQSRLNEVSYNFESQLPVLSDAERKLLKGLKELNGKVEKQEKDVVLLKRNCDYNKRMMSELATATQPPSPSSPSLKESNINVEKANSIHLLLKKEGEEISNLVKGVRKLKVLTDV